MIMLLTKDPHSTRRDILSFKAEVEKYLSNKSDIDLMLSIFKQAAFLNILICSNDTLNHKNHINGMIYDTLNSIISILNKRERYLHLNIRSIIEHIARIALNKTYQGGDYDGTVRRKDFDFLKKEKPSENWKYLHESYIRACHFIHSSPQAKLNVTSTFMELLHSDHGAKVSKQIITLHKNITTITKIFLVYFISEISSTFFRTQTELRFLLGGSLYSEYELLDKS
ncbi:Uncharacterised protein [Serratia fonticola]|nr:Uncharacterised protein [Serratia fonticola]CAI1790720.1 Uncharacterised protein [Serratia fonticola]CAI1849298.1 Uncharacterised protein [Serratia fonticola]